MMWKRFGRAAAVTAAAALLGIAGGCSKTSDNGNKGGAENTTPTKASATAGTKAPVAAAAVNTAPAAAAAQPDPAAGAARPDPAAGAAAATGAKTGNETKQYKIELAAPEQVKAGAENALTVVVTPKPGWHFNLEFPTSVKVEVPAGMKVAKATQRLDDAVDKSEQKGATWAIKVTPEQPGSGKLTCKVKFAVCTETTCDPKRETLALQLDAK